MKKLTCIVLSIMLCLIALLAGCQKQETAPADVPEAAPAAGDAALASDDVSAGAAPAAADSQVKLTYGSNLPPVAVIAVQDMEVWIPSVTEKTGGTVEIEPFWAESLVASESAYSECLAGLADMVSLIPGKMMEHFVIENSVGYFFYGMSDLHDTLPIIRETWSEFEPWQKEFEGGELLSFGSTGAVWLHLAKPINSLSEIKGMTIRVSEPFVEDVVRALGAEPVYTSLSETADQLSKGIINGIALTYDCLQGLGIADLTTYSTYLGFTAPGNAQKFISDAAIAKLSENQMNQLREACLALEAQTPDYSVANDAKVEAWMNESHPDHITVKELNADDLAFVNETLAKLAQDKIAELNAAGYDGQALFDLIRSKIEK